MQTGLSMEMTETGTTQENLILTSFILTHDPKPFGRKKKAPPVDPLEATIQKFIALKTRCLPEDLLMMLSRNLAAAWKTLNESGWKYTAETYMGTIELTWMQEYQDSGLSNNCQVQGKYNMNQPHDHHYQHEQQQNTFLHPSTGFKQVLNFFN